MKDAISAPGRDHTCSTPSLRCFASVAFETVSVIVWFSDVGVCVLASVSVPVSVRLAQTNKRISEHARSVFPRPCECTIRGTVSPCSIVLRLLTVLVGTCGTCTRSLAPTTNYHTRTTTYRTIRLFQTSTVCCAGSISNRRMNEEVTIGCCLSKTVNVVLSIG